MLIAAAGGKEMATKRKAALSPCIVTAHPEKLGE